MNRNVEQLTKLAAAYRAAEEAIVNAFFATPRRRFGRLFSSYGYIAGELFGGHQMNGRLVLQGG